MPFGEMLENTLATMGTWMKNWILPVNKEGELVWYLAVALGLTLCWMVFSNEKTKEFFNNLGGWVVAAMFFAIALGFLISIPMYFWNIFDIWWVFKVVIFLVLYWLIGFLIKLAGGFLWNSIKMVFGWAKSIPAKAKANPHGLWRIAGGLFLAGLICGEKATMITKQWGLVPGIIPGISAVIGLVFLILQIRRTALGEEVVVRATTGAQATTRSDGSWRCQGAVPKMTMEDGELVHVPIRDGQGNLILVEGEPQMQMVPCSNWNTAEASSCLSCGKPKS